ncbi:hypothetical protein WME97_39885 [Sorangium sp. So ce367]
MVEAISNTRPLLYLHRIGAIDWLAEMYGHDCARRLFGHVPADAT